MGRFRQRAGDLSLRRFTGSSHLLEAVLGCPGKNMKNELYVLKEKKSFLFLLVKVRWNIAFYPKFPREIMKFLWDRFSQSRKTREILTFIWQRFIY